MTIVRLLSGILIAGLCFGYTTVLDAQADTLKGGVQQNQHYQKGPGLNRSDIKGNDDPFAAGEQQQALEAPKQMFKADPPMKARIEQSGGMQQSPMAAPQNMPIDGLDDAMPQAPMQLQAPFNPHDPDSSPEMQLAWDMWHKRVAATIFDRFNFFAKAAFKHSPPLIAELSYVVSRDGRIGNLQVRRKSSNVLFNVLVFQAVKSLDGDISVLAFPQGSKRMFVPKAGTFTQNYGGGEGFRHTVGDNERVR